MSNDNFLSIIRDIRAERKRQDNKWGAKLHPNDKWLSILVEEVGEAATAQLNNDDVNLREELTQVAAVCVKWLEMLMEQKNEQGRVFQA